VTPDPPTCWTLLREVVAGDAAARERFARSYEPVARSYLAARWRSSTRLPQLDDAVQDLFVECFRTGGILAKVDERHPGGFRAYFFGALRNIARRHESERRLPDSLPAEVEADDTTLAAAFDKAWAKALLKEAARVQAETAERVGERALRRIELLRLRFQEGLPIRAIAERWSADPAALHREYATARNEFSDALRSVVAFYHPSAGPTELQAACSELLALIG